MQGYGFGKIPIRPPQSVGQGLKIGPAVLFSPFGMIVFRNPKRCRCVLVGTTIRGDDMMSLEQVKQNRELVNSIDWEMTPEEAVRLYLEWGNNWARGNYVIRSKDDVSHYFVVNTWKEEPVIYLIRRNSEEAVELATITMPIDLKRRFLHTQGRHKGVWALEGEVKSWLQQQLNVH